jgi:NADH dehydrogenase
LSSTMIKGTIKIETGSRVTIVGGGPAGMFFALYLQHYSEENKIRPEITVYQQRNFAERGPKGCKGCAGVLSESLLSSLSELGLTLPEEVVQDRIKAFTLHSPYTSISISNPEKEKEIVSVYRGSGPRISLGNEVVSFDGWLLEQVKSRGIKVENQAASRIHLEHQTGIEVADRKLECDLVVLAKGVTTKPLPITGLAYVPPKTRTMAVDELYAGIDQVESRLGNTAHGFMIPRLGIIFGGLVPKGHFITVTVLNIDDRRPVSITDFLSYDIVRKVLPDRYERVCGCRPQALVGSAGNYYTDRFVAIGDAAVSKIYLDGIGSSLLTARQAAHTVVYHGISRQDFARHYQPICESIDRDNRWGRMLFSINHIAKNSRSFLLTQHRLTGIEQNNTRGPQPFTKAAWGMSTGSYNYRDIFRNLLHLPSVVRLFRVLLLESIRGLFHKGVVKPRALHIGGKKVLILGSGFGGTYTLRNLVPHLNLNENVETTIVSDENYFLFTPLLHEVAMGRIEMRHIAYPIRSLHWRDRFKLIRSNVEKIDLDTRQVVTTTGTLDFDYLVLALGSVTDMTALRSGGENVFTLKTLGDARLLRNHIMGVFEQAIIEKDQQRQRRLLTFVIAGAGYTGVQVVAGLRDLIYHDLIRFYNSIDRNNIRVILVEAAPIIVADLHVKLGAYVINYLKKTGIEVRLQSQVTRVWEGGVEINSSENIPANTIIWVSGVVVNPRIAELNVPRDSMGRVMVNEYLEVLEAPGVYAVGDCAHIKDPRSGRPIPPLAHTAVRHAKIVARNILADIRGENKKPYLYSKPPDMVSLGTYKAVFRYRFLRLYGLLPRILMDLGYFFLVTGTSHRIRIVTDWLLSLFFHRDTTLLRKDK